MPCCFGFRAVTIKLLVTFCCRECNFSFTCVSPQQSNDKFPTSMCEQHSATWFYWLWSWTVRRFNFLVEPTPREDYMLDHTYSRTGNCGKTACHHLDERNSPVSAAFMHQDCDYICLILSRCQLLICSCGCQYLHAILWCRDTFEVWCIHIHLQNILKGNCAALNTSVSFFRLQFI